MAQQATASQSNIANFGSKDDFEQRIKKARLEDEWKDVGQKPGLEIWRIEKLNVKKWPKNLYGSFYEGDSYIVLNTYLKGNRLCWDVHYWLGKESSQDEITVAAYKTVELDDVLHGAPVQHREVMGYESPLFLSYFNDKITILKGGIDSALRTVKPEEMKPKLLHIKGKRRVRVMEVPLTSESLNTGDAFVLDAGTKVFIWCPSKAGINEKFRASQVARDIRSSRKGKIEEIRLDEEGNDEFWEILGGKDKIKDADEVTPDEEFEKLGLSAKKLFRLSDASGKMEFTKIAEGKLSKDQLDTNDVFIIDAGEEILVWVGKNTSPDERKKAVMYAQSYLGLEKKPSWIPITRVMEGNETKRFFELFSN